ncbi:MAG: hypothetical protein ACW980_24190 [Promethearchaeota archaeon]|jgi:nitrogen regulatory protein PII-like uncharacterized protein
MIVSLNKIYKLIQDNNYKSAKLYEGDLTENSRAFENIKRETPQDLIKRLQELEEIVSGKFTILLGKGTEGEQKRNMLEVKTEFYETLISPSPSLNGQSEDFVSMSSLNQKVDELVNQRLRDMERDKEVNDLRAKVAEMETLGGKVNYLLTGFVTKFIEAKLTPQTNNSMQGYKKEYDPETAEIESIEDLENNLAVIVDYFGEKNIQKFANKIQQGSADAVKPIIINFINN